MMPVSATVQPKANGLKISLGGRPFYGDGLQRLKKRLSRKKTSRSDIRLLSKHSMVEGFLGRDDRKTTAYLDIREQLCF